MKKSIDIFLGYATDDRELCLQLKKHLTWLEREGLIRTWHEYNVSAGMERASEIHRHLELAHIILLFISADFIDQDFCYCDQLKHAMERHTQGKARVIPIILRTVYWEETPLGKLQALPRNNIPIKMWSDLDEAFADVEKDIRAVVKELITEEYTQEGERLFSDRQYEQVLEACGCALRWAPTFATAYRLKGLALLELKRYDEAHMAYEQAIRLDLNTDTVYKEKGDVLFHLKRYNEAVTSYQEAISREPASVDAHMGASKALRELARANLRLAKEYKEKAYKLLALAGSSKQEGFEWSQ